MSEIIERKKMGEVLGLDGSLFDDNDFTEGDKVVFEEFSKLISKFRRGEIELNDFKGFLGSFLGRCETEAAKVAIEQIFNITIRNNIREDRTKFENEKKTFRLRIMNSLMKDRIKNLLVQALEIENIDRKKALLAQALNFVKEDYDEKSEDYETSINFILQIASFLNIKLQN